ncbi:MAG: 2-amino-4-hydroxy-6-hydroxymethyldihydropteridine diphosphokinase [Acidimicrobiales bacterium]|nr:2-amino-4-hydroxy-6-hydroxymethyldihydropteridine diphosphokinase [Acidimicrobiales bacterium]
MVTTRALLGLGSNLGDRWKLLRDAVGSIPDVVAVSSVYESDPVGGPEQGQFLNLVVRLETERSARELLEVCQRCEEAAERVRVERWGPRTLDVDVLWVDGETVDEPDLIVPHPRTFERAFVVLPLRDVAPDVAPDDWEHPSDQQLRRVGTLFAGPDEGRSVAIVGPGRAGQAMGQAIEQIGWASVRYFGRNDDLDGIRSDELVIIATPDAAVADVATAIPEVEDRPVLHVAGSLGVDVLAGHRRAAALHPVLAMPTPAIGAHRLLDDAWFAICGDRAADELAVAMGGRSFWVEDHDRAAYHAAAVVASNHVTALLGQVWRITGSIVVPREPFFRLARSAIDNVATLGPQKALTGPVARGDHETIERHRAALDPSEVELYDALVAAALRVKDNRP